MSLRAAPLVPRLSRSPLSPLLLPFHADGHGCASWGAVTPQCDWLCPSRRPCTSRGRARAAARGLVAHLELRQLKNLNFWYGDSGGSDGPSSIARPSACNPLSFLRLEGVVDRFGRVCGVVAAAAAPVTDVKPIVSEGDGPDHCVKCARMHFGGNQASTCNFESHGNYKRF